MTDLVIRPVQPGDLLAVRALNLQASDPDARPTDDPSAYPELFDLDASYRDGAFLVGTVSGEVVAMGAVRPVARSQHLADAGPTTFELDYLRVAIPHQRRGLARRLIEALEERARHLGATALILDTTEAQVPAQRLYEAVGFTETRRSVLENDFGRFPIVHYRKELDAPA